MKGELKMRSKVKKWKEEQKVLSSLNNKLPLTAKMLSFINGYTPQKNSIVLCRLVEKNKVVKYKWNKKYWYRLQNRG